MKKNNLYKKHSVILDLKQIARRESHFSLNSDKKWIIWISYRNTDQRCSCANTAYSSRMCDLGSRKKLRELIRNTYHHLLPQVPTTCSTVFGNTLRNIRQIHHKQWFSMHRREAARWTKWKKEQKVVGNCEMKQKNTSDTIGSQCKTVVNAHHYTDETSLNTSTHS